MAKTKRKVKMPSKIRSKMMAAVAMLLVSLILMISTTYAWFTLSTAPEVKNITTTVAGNGSLEIALMPEDGLLGSIKNGFSSTAVVGGTVAIKEANTTWGNLLTLSENGNDPYGLDSITLMPATLNQQAANVGYPGASILGTAGYGFDGRTTTLVYDMVNKSYNGESGKFNADDFGVRAIGEIDGDDLATYGYIVDLAMRINTKKDNGTDASLYLQSDPMQRIYSESGNDTTQGGGSFMEFTSEMGASVIDLMKAIRVTFVSNLGRSGGEDSYEILGTAQLDMEAAKVSGNVQFNLGKDAFGPNYVLGRDAYAANSGAKTLLGQEAFEQLTYKLGRDAYTFDKYVLGKNAYEQDAKNATKYNLTAVAKTVYNATNAMLYNETITAADYEKLAEKTMSRYKVRSMYTADNCENYVKYAADGATPAAGETAYKAGYDNGTISTVEYNQLDTRTYAVKYALKAEYTTVGDYQNSDILKDETVAGAAKKTIDAAAYRSLEANNKMVDYVLTDKATYTEQNCTNFAEGLTSGEYTSLAEKTKSEEFSLSTAAKKIYTAKNTLNYPKDGILTTVGYGALAEKTTTPHAKAYLTLGTDGLLTTLQKNAAKQISAVVWLDGDAVDSGDVAYDGNSLSGSLNLQFSTDAALTPATNETFNTAVSYTEHTYSIDSKTYYKASGDGRWYQKIEGKIVDGEKQPDTYEFVGVALNDKLELDVKISEGKMTTKELDGKTYYKDTEDGVWYDSALDRVTDQSLIQKLNQSE